MKGVCFAVVVLALAACTQPTQPIEGPDVKTASDDALEQYTRDCMRCGRHSEKGAKYTQEYCIEAAQESFQRLRVRKKAASLPR